jgi:hypothetical protein
MELPSGIVCTAEVVRLYGGYAASVLNILGIRPESRRTPPKHRGEPCKFHHTKESAPLYKKVLD